MNLRNTVAAVAALWLGLAAANSYADGAASPTNSVSATESGKPPIVGVKDFLKDPAPYAGREVVLEGFVTDVCRKKGCWALLHDSDADAKGQVRVQQNEEGDTFKPFLPELQGKTILVTSEVKETKIDQDYLDKWEARVNAAKDQAAQAGDKKKDSGEAYDAVLKQIARYRERLAKATDGHLSSYSLTVVKWEPQAEKP
jgi:hypothetical protein